MMVVVNVMLLAFMVTAPGLAPALAGAILGAVRLLDRVVDPLMGALSDRIRTRWGRRRAWMFAGGLGSGVATFALFSVPALPSAAALAAYVAGLVGPGLAPLLLSTFGSTREGFAKMGLAVGACVAATMLFWVFATAAARQARSVEKAAVIASLGVLRNRDFTALLLVKFTALFAIGANAAVVLLTLSMLPDVTSDEQDRTGRQVGGAMAGAVLSLTGFASGGPGTVQTAESVRGIAIAATVLPAVSSLAAVPLVFRYSVTRRRLASTPPAP
jgi:Na+/melibiose symporter-like transporter